jgi:hypothetical protein
MEMPNIPDIESEDYDLARKQLARRRKLAEELLNTPFNKGVQTGSTFTAARADPGAFLSRAAGQINQNRIDSEETALSQRERQAQDAILSSIPELGSPERQQAQHKAALRMPSLRGMIESQMAGDTRTQDRADERQWRTEQAEANRIESGEQKAQDRVSREELRATPS